MLSRSQRKYRPLVCKPITLVGCMVHRRREVGTVPRLFSKCRHGEGIACVCPVYTRYNANARSGVLERKDCVDCAGHINAGTTTTTIKHNVRDACSSELTVRASLVLSMYVHVSLKKQCRSQLRTCAGLTPENAHVSATKKCRSWFLDIVQVPG